MIMISIAIFNIIQFIIVILFFIIKRYFENSNNDFDNFLQISKMIRNIYIIWEKLYINTTIVFEKNKLLIQDWKFVIMKCSLIKIF